MGHERRSDHNDRDADSSGVSAVATYHRAPHGPDPVSAVQAFADACTSAGEVLGAQLWMEDASTSTLRLAYSAGRFRPSGDPRAVASTIAGEAIRDHAAVMRSAGEVVVRGRKRTLWSFAVPVESIDVRGVVQVDLAAENPDAIMLNRVASIHRTILSCALATYVAHERSRTALATLSAAKSLSHETDPAHLVEEMLNHAVELADADTGSVMLVADDGRLEIAAARGLPPDIVAQTRVAEGEGIAGWVLATGQSVVIEDLVETQRGRRHGIRAAISVPLVDADGILGVINVGAREHRARPTHSVGEALETLGHVGAVALRGARAYESSREMYVDTLRALARAVEANNPVDPGSVERLLTVTLDLSAACGLGEAQREALRIAALMHDSGMAGIGTSAPQWERPLTTVEWGLVRIHPVIAAHTLLQVPALADAIPVVLHHHERFDGTGYVDGLAGEDIPLEARIFSVADAYVAMTSMRPYRAPMTTLEALTELRAQAGTQFDPMVVEALVDIGDDRDWWSRVRS